MDIFEKGMAISLLWTWRPTSVQHMTVFLLACAVRLYRAKLFEVKIRVYGAESDSTCAIQNQFGLDYTDGGNTGLRLPVVLKSYNCVLNSSRE